MNRIPRASFILGAIAIFSTLIVACSHPSQNQSEPDLSVATRQVSSSTTAKKQSIALLERGVSKATIGNYQEAMADYNQSLKIDPKNPEAYYNRGVAQYYQGLQQLELKDFNRVQSLQQLALLDFNRAIQLDPSFAEAYANRGELRWQQGDKQGAMQDFQQAAKLFAQKGDKASFEQINELINQL